MVTFHCREDPRQSEKTREKPIWWGEAYRQSRYRFVHASEGARKRVPRKHSRNADGPDRSDQWGSAWRLLRVKLARVSFTVTRRIAWRCYWTAAYDRSWSQAGGRK